MRTYLSTELDNNNAMKRNNVRDSRKISEMRRKASKRNNNRNNNTCNTYTIEEVSTALALASITRQNSVNNETNQLIMDQMITSTDETHSNRDTYGVNSGQTERQLASPPKSDFTSQESDSCPQKEEHKLIDKPRAPPTETMRATNNVYEEQLMDGNGAYANFYANSDPNYAYYYGYQSGYQYPYYPTYHQTAAQTATQYRQCPYCMMTSVAMPSTPIPKSRQQSADAMSTRMPLKVSSARNAPIVESTPIAISSLYPYYQNGPKLTSASVAPNHQMMTN